MLVPVPALGGGESASDPSNDKAALNGGVISVAGAACRSSELMCEGRSLEGVEDIVTTNLIICYYG